MRKAIAYILLFVLFVGCADEPTPSEKAMAEIRAKYKQRFEMIDNSFSKKEQKKSKKIEFSKKSKEDPTAYVYNSKVLNEKEEALWRAVGVDSKSYPKWASLGVKPEEVKGWKDLNVSNSTISLFKKLEYTPSKAKKFIKQQFDSYPKIYKQFGNRVYEFDRICKVVIKRQLPPFAFLEDECIPYMKKIDRYEIIGHLLDKAGVKRGPLAVEYLAGLRGLREAGDKIESGMEVTIEEFIEDGDTKNFTFLFPLLKIEPTDEEIRFIDKNRLPLEKDERYISYNNPKYWAKKAAMKKAAQKAAKKEEARLRAKRKELNALKAKRRAKRLKLAKKTAVEKKKKAAIKAEINRRIKAQKRCGKYLSYKQLSNRYALVEGNIIFTVGEQGSKMFGYAVISSIDNNIYFIRDPKNLAHAKLKDMVSWRVKTLGRTEALSQISKDRFVYDKNSKTKFTMALFLKECKTY